MSVLGDFYRLEHGSLEPIVEPGNEVQLKVADSWLVEDGRVRSLPAHFQRFAGWVEKVDPEQTDRLPDFFAEVKKLLPLTGRWFPRMEYHGEQPSSHRLYLRLRPAPERLESVVLWSYPEPDPRHDPSTKGPDLSLCQQLRRHANMNGADEAVILDAEGFVAEGALSSLVWWRGDTLCSSNDLTRWLPSITRQEIFDIANQIGLETKLERIKPAELASLPIWALSSLNGIMPVRAWVGINDSMATSAHQEAFSKRLRMLSAQLD